jgi:TRAP transporter 4TM/12TM fusion protein
MSTPATDTTSASDFDRRLQEIGAQYDAERQARGTGMFVRNFCYVFLVLFGIYHYVTAGIGLPIDYWHMGIHLGGVLLMIFLLFPIKAVPFGAKPLPASWWRPSGVPLPDWILGIVGVAAALYLGFSWEGLNFPALGIKIPEQALRQGNPATLDVFFAVAITVLVLEATRRTIGWTMPVVILCFMAFAIWGPYMPLQILKHPGISWDHFLTSMYFPSEGIFGVTLWVVATVVFHFVLFGAFVQRIGLGQFFVDLSTVIAGRAIGGPAKVSVVASAFFGMISGSAVANAVTVGALTIPNMKRLGYPPHFAGAVEAAASVGGQVTPPIMGAAAFIMAEFLNLPYAQIAIAAAVPAFMHYLGVMAIVHFEAKRLRLRSYEKHEIPEIWPVIKRGWPTLIPLLVLLYVLFDGYTPYMAAFWSITACIIVGFLNPYRRLTVRDMLDAFYEGGRSALSVGAICAAVGIVVGAMNVTGLAFRLGFVVTGSAQQAGQAIHDLVSFFPFELFTLKDATLFLSMLFIAFACVALGSGIPTTALYIMLATVAQPALAQLGVPALASHMFVFYFGLIADITPPVCTTAFAAAAIAGANPWKTGNTAFKLSNAKIMVPFVFCYAPAMLIVLPEYFTWFAFLETTISCMAGVIILAMALTGFAYRPIPHLIRWTTGLGGLMLVFPSTTSDIIALALVIPLVIQQTLAIRRSPA